MIHIIKHELQGPSLEVTLAPGSCSHWRFSVLTTAFVLLITTFSWIYFLHLVQGTTLSWFSSYHTLDTFTSLFKPTPFWNLIFHLRAGLMPTKCNTVGISTPKVSLPTGPLQELQTFLLNSSLLLLCLSMWVSTKHHKHTPNWISDLFSKAYSFYRHLISLNSNSSLAIFCLVLISLHQPWFFCCSISNTSGILLPQNTGVFTLFFGDMLPPNLQITQYLAKFRSLLKMPPSQWSLPWLFKMEDPILTVLNPFLWFIFLI